MKLLFIVPYVPNLVRVRPYQFIRTLAQRGHQITLATLPVNAAEQADLAHLQALGVRVLAQPMPGWRSAINSALALPSATPLQAVYSYHRQLQTRIEQLLTDERFDAIHIEHLRGSRYGLALQSFFARRPLLGRSARFAQPAPPIIWDSVDCISHLFAQAAQRSRSLKGRWLTQLELGRTRHYEGRLVHAFDHTVVTSAIDQRALMALAQAHQPPTARQHPPIEVVPNGVDLTGFGYVNGAARPATRIIFSGKMSYHANVTAAVHLVETIMPTVWAQRPETEVWIVGKEPAAEVRSLCAGRPRVHVTGEVSDVAAHLHLATVAVAPLLYGAGIQNKVLEAMACGAPVVASPQATAALAAEAGRELLVAEAPADFARAITTLLDDPTRRAQLSHAGRHFVERHHTWDGAAQRLEELYRNQQNL